MQSNAEVVSSSLTWSTTILDTGNPLLSPCPKERVTLPLAISVPAADSSARTARSAVGRKPVALELLTKRPVPPAHYPAAGIWPFTDRSLIVLVFGVSFDSTQSQATVQGIRTAGCGVLHQ